MEIAKETYIGSVMYVTCQAIRAGKAFPALFDCLHFVEKAGCCDLTGST